MSEEPISKQAAERRPGTGRTKRRRQSPPRDKTIDFRLTQQEYAALREAANRSHWALRAFVAHTVLSEVKGTRKPEHAELRALLEELMQVGGEIRQLGVTLDQVAAELHPGELTQQLGADAQACARLVDKVDRVADAICRRLP
ncbi:plasmid mobilization protein [Actinomadura harenae]|uniref:Plasmid mobilization relaxosome protein MobC n=1 Tax=Actinomadura harenae TaxID=2483351 RepID=A0A3M2MB77_9ACTN|nr:hypothetical protein [Actinomadura harenae]RMI46133.1 hypothetical protein EBO15_07885 [Actinomadura harenae]